MTEEIIEETMTGDVETGEVVEPTALEIEAAEAQRKEKSKHRFSQIDGERRENKRLYDSALAELAALRLQIAQNTATVTSKTDNTGKPDPDKYPAGKYDPDYVEALTDYKVEQRTRQILDEREEKAIIKVQRQKIDAMEVKAKVDHIDYDDVIVDVFEHPLAQVKAFQDLITDCENPAEMVYFLGKNPDELDKLQGMTQSQAARYIGRLESKLDSPSPTPVKKTSDAPAPITPLKGAQSSTVTTQDPSKMSVADYAKWRKSGGK